MRPIIHSPFLLLILLTVLSATQAVGQNKEVPKDQRRLIQFSGVLLTADSLEAVPFANIIVKNSRRGTISDYFGYFSFVAEPFDTIVFSYLGFKDSEFVIPDTLNSRNYSLIQMMSADTFLLQEAVVYPWPTKEQFRQAFLDLRLPEDDKQVAMRNLEWFEMRERADAMGMDGSENFKYAMQQHAARLYYAGQLPPNNLLNPLAWARFIKAWKNGEFKRREKKD
ncbi:MAG: carboxypeptidase-like regulatory domain-containing protein [Flavobacteriales bacterium]|nr:carboxypeptidase-like regulatory domain-containing protein [Flavobacteriales bacterium]